MRSLALVFLVAIGLALGAGPAAAGGPTSVLLAAPSEARVAALYHTDADYTALQSLLDDGAEIEGASDFDSGPYVTVTWLVHDVSVWRTDRILLAEGIVETTLIMGAPEGAEPVRRALRQPERLTEVLGRLGFTGEATPAGTQAVAAPVVPAAQQAPVPVEPGTDARWEWGIGGLLLGALAAVLVVRARAVRARAVRAAR
ncbi:hypothetical protein [Actinokineospora sp. NPDC004072]